MHQAGSRAHGLAHTAGIGHGLALWAGPHIAQSDVGWPTQHAARCRLACGHLMVGGLAREQLQRVWDGPRALRKRVSQLAACKMISFPVDLQNGRRGRLAGS